MGLWGKSHNYERSCKITIDCGFHFLCGFEELIAVFRVNLEVNLVMGREKQLARERKRSAASCQRLDSFFKKQKESENVGRALDSHTVAVVVDSGQPGSSHESAARVLISPNQANETSGNAS